MRTLGILGLLWAAACASGPKAEPLDAALDAFHRGDFETADRLLRGTRDPEALLVRADLELLRNRNREAVDVLGPLANPGTGPYADMAYSKMAVALVRMDDFLRASEVYRFLGEQILSEKYKALVRNVGYLTNLGTAEVHVPFETTDPVPSVRMAVNGRVGTFILDTGMDEIVLDREFARQARVKGIGLRTTALKRSYDEAVIDEIDLGSVRIRNVPGHVGELAAIAALKADGAIGLAFLMHFDFTIDFRRGRLTLRRAGGPIAGEPLVWAGDRHLLVRGKADGAFECWVGIQTGLAGVTVAPSPNLQRLRPGPLQDLAAGPLRLVHPPVNSDAFPTGLEASFGVPVGYVLGPVAFRGKALRVDPRSMKLLID